MGYSLWRVWLKTRVISAHIIEKGSKKNRRVMSFGPSRQLIIYYSLEMESQHWRKVDSWSHRKKKWVWLAGIPQPENSVFLICLSNFHSSFGPGVPFFSRFLSSFFTCFFYVSSPVSFLLKRCIVYLSSAELHCLQPTPPYKPVSSISKES